jgi:SAM-dependent methyltransferase
MGIVDTVNGLLEPWLFLGLSVSYLPGTIVGLVRSREWSSFTSFDKFSFAWFGRFWTFVGPMVRESNEARVAPLLQGRVRAGMIVSAEDAVTPGVGGTVIEIGPGNGNWSGIFADSYVSTEAGLKGEDKNGERTRVNKVFGIEPNAAHHATLSRRAKEAGLEDRYQIVPVGIEDITPQLIEKESVDAIVTVLCLCSIPEPEKNIRELYTYLKPGGRW